MLKNKSGFTLVELLVVMAIMGILAVITLANFTTSQAKGRDAQRKSDLRQISNALEAYYTDHGVYPSSGTTGSDVGKILACSGANCASQVACSWGGTTNREFCDINSTVYMKEIPDDTVSSQHYCYYSDGKLWRLFANLENTKDIDCLSRNAAGTCLVAAKCNSAANNYVYGISSTNTTPTTP